MPALSVGNTFTVSTLEDGTSPWFADIENEMDSVACDSEGHPIATYNRTFAVKMWHGSEQVELTAITIGTTPMGITATGNASAKTITISVATTATIAQVNEVSFTLSADGTTPMPLHFILNGVRPGANGDPAVVWRLVPSHSEIVKKKDGTTWPTGNIVCGVTKTVGGTTTPVTTGFTLKRSIDGASEIAYADTPASSVTTSLAFILYVGGSVVDRETLPVVTDGIDGDSPWIADISNELDSIACDSGGKPVAAQNVTATLYLYHGATSESFVISTVGVYLNGNQMSYTSTNTWKDNTSNPTRTVTFNGTTHVMTVAYTTSAVINHKDDFKITLYNQDNNISADVSLTVSGIKGDARYNLVPSASAISRSSAGAYNPTTLTCTYTKYDVSKGAFVTASGATIKYVKDNDSEVNAITYSTALTPGTTFTNKVTFLLYVGTTIVDRETVLIVKDGATGPQGPTGPTGPTGPQGPPGGDGDDGKDAQYIFLQGSARDVSGGSTSKPRIVRINGVDKVNEYGSIGLKLVIIERSTLNVKKVNGVDQIFWYDTYNDAHPNGTVSPGAGTISDLVTKLNSLDDTVFIALTSFDAIGWSVSLVNKLKEFGFGGLGTFSPTGYGRYPFAFLGYRGLGEGYALSVLYDAGSSDHVATVGAYIVNGTFQSSKDGADAVLYEIRTVTNNLSVQPNGKYAGNLTWKVVKHEGASTSDMSTGTFRWRLLGNGWQEDYRQGTSCSILSGNTWSSFPSSSGMNCAVSIQLSYVDTSSVEQATVTVPINIEGQMSRNLYYAGEWASGLSFEVTDYKAPYYSWTQGGLTKYWAFVGANGTYTSSSAGDPSDNNSNWREMNNEFKYLITEAIFAGSFAHFGGTVINGDYMFSQHGYLLGFGDEKLEISNGTQYQNVDPNDMFGQKGAYLEDGSRSVHIVSTSGVSVSSTSWTTVSSSSASLLSGYYYTWQVIGEGKFNWRIRMSSTDIATGTIDSADVTTQNGFAPVTSAGSYSFQVQKVSSSYSSTKYYALHLNKCKFVPWLCLNMRSGESQMNRLYLRAGLVRSSLTITPSNYSQYSTQTTARTKYKNSLGNWTYGIVNINVLNVFSLGTNVRLSGSFSDSPNLFCPLFQDMDDNEKDIVRGLAGQQITVVNKSGTTVRFYGSFVSQHNGSYGTTTNGNSWIFEMANNKVAIITVDYTMEETITAAPSGQSFSGYTHKIEYGSEEVLCRLRMTDSTEFANL